jgi:hypothetical protein
MEADRNVSSSSLSICCDRIATYSLNNKKMPIIIISNPTFSILVESDEELTEAAAIAGRAIATKAEAVARGMMWWFMFMFYRYYLIGCRCYVIPLPKFASFGCRSLCHFAFT